MGDIIADGRVRTSFVLALANKNLPTVAELNAGLLLQLTLTPDGLVSFRPSTAKVATGSLGSRFGTQRNGRVSFDDGMMLRLKKQDGTDTLYDTLTYGTTGFMVIRQSILQEVAWASAQKIRVYPVECGEVAHVDVDENTLERYEVPLAVYDQPNLRAQVA